MKWKWFFKLFARRPKATSAIRALSQAEYLESFSPPMVDVTNSATPALDVWTYVDQLSAISLGVARLEDVELVFASPDNRFHHVLIGTGSDNTYLVVIVDVPSTSIIGHRVLDLNYEYGLATKH